MMISGEAGGRIRASFGSHSLESNLFGEEKNMAALRPMPSPLQTSWVMSNRNGILHEHPEGGAGSNFDPLAQKGH
jgi:hypothetical protein